MQTERHRLGLCGAEKMARDFSWAAIARRRLYDYQAALGSPERLPKKVLSKELAERAD